MQSYILTSAFMNMQKNPSYQLTGGMDGGTAGNAVILDPSSLFKSKLASLTSTSLASSWVICTDRTWIRGDMSGFVLNEYVGNTSNVSCTQDICLFRSGPETLPLPLFSKVLEDLVRKMLLGHSFVLAIGSVQHAFLDTLSQASTTRSVLRNWDICSFMVSRPFVSWLWASCRACVGDLAGDCPVRGRGVVQNARSCSIEMLRESREGWDGAVFGRPWSKSIFSLADRFGRKGLESLRLSLPDVDGRGGGGSLLAPALASVIRALHDLVRLMILRRRPSLGMGWSAGVPVPSLTAAGGRL